MSTIATQALRRAVHARLSNDPVLSSVVSGVFDHVPKTASLPYVRLGPVTATVWSTKSFSGQRHRLTLQIFSQAEGDLEILELIDVVHGLLDRPTFSLEGHHLVELSFESATTLREPDGIRQAELRFAALTHPI